MTTLIKDSKSNRWLLASVSFGALLALSGIPAYAQDNGSGGQGDVAEDDVSVQETVVITGIRGSLQRAQDIKRSSDSVVDAIASTDLGRFSDEAISDAIQRVPGVQIERNDGGQEGDRASIRGLGPTFVNTTVNGRTTLSSGTEFLTNLRSFNLEVIPTDVISGIVVKKTPTASDVEHGLAGLVEIETRRPLDNANFLNSDSNTFGSATVRGDIGSIGQNLGYRVNGIAGWRSNDDTLGFYVTGLFGESNPERNQLFPSVVQRDIQIDNDGDGIADVVQPGVFTINDIDFEPLPEDRERIAASAAVQWQPNDRIDINIDAVYTSFDNVSVRNRVAVGFGDALDTLVFDANDIVIDDTNTLQAVLPGGFAGADISTIFIPFLFRNETETLIGGANFDYQVTDNFNVNIDVHYSGVDYFQDLDLPVFAQSVPGEEVSFNTDNGLFAADLGSLSLDGFSLDPGAVLVRDVFGTGDEYGARIDFENTFDNAGPLTSVEWGLRYTRADVDSLRTNIISVGTDLTPEELAAITTQVIDQSETGDFNFFPGDGVLTNDLENPFPIGSLETAIDLIPALGELNDIAADPASSFSFVEDVIAAYAEANLAGEIGGIPYTGNVGLRVVNAQVAGVGESIQPDGTTLPNSNTDDYTRLLPSVNLSFDLREDLVLRLGSSRVLSRPNPSDLVPREAANQVTTAFDIPTATSGNPNLDPTTAWTFDSTLEWYNDYDGAFVFSFFYKRVKDFILPITTQGLLPGQGDTVFDIRTPQNFSDGDVVGFEIGFNQPFTFLPSPLDGFGLQANYTFVDSGFDEDIAATFIDSGFDTGADAVDFSFPGSSRNNFNAILYYEKGPIGIRAAVVSRDDFFRNLPGQGAQQENSSALFSEGDTRVNLNATYNFGDHLSFFVDVNNLTEEGRRDFFLQEETFNGAFRRERTITFGATARF